MDKLTLKISLREIFYFFFWLYLALMLLELFSPNIVLAYFNLNYLFLIVVLSGISFLIKK